jgi:nucleoside-diphosphate-sugar epimerase
MKNIFLTGATGYVGRVVAEKLLASGYKVTALVRSEHAAQAVQAMGVRPFYGDMASPAQAAEGVRDCDAVVHTAFRFEKGDRPFEPGPKAARIVLQALHGELEMARAFSRELRKTNKPFIFTSGTGLFGDTSNLVPDEETPVHAQGLFSIRCRAEREVLEAAQHGIRTIVLRSATVYGRGGSMLVPILLDAAKRRGVSCYIEGTETNKWSAVHVDDLADLYLLALHSAPFGSLFHASAESGITTSSIAEAVSQAADLGGKAKSVDKDEAFEILGGFAEFWSLNNQSCGNKACTVLNWRPVRGPMTSEIAAGSYCGRGAEVRVS